MDALTHPERQVDFAFLGGELEHPRVSDSLFPAVDELEEHRVGDVKSCELFEGADGQEHLATVVELVAVGAWHHGERVAAVIFIEAAGHAPSPLGEKRLIKTCWVFFEECLRLSSVVKTSSARGMRVLTILLAIHAILRTLGAVELT